MRRPRHVESENDDEKQVIIIITQCTDKKSIHPNSPHGRSSEIPWGRGILKAKILDAKYEAKVGFPGGTGGARQKTFHGGVWIFYETAQYSTASCIY